MFLILLLLLTNTFASNQSNCLFNTLVFTKQNCDNLDVLQDNVDAGILLLDRVGHLFSQFEKVSFTEYSTFIFENGGYLQSNFSVILSNIFILSVREEGYRPLISIDNGEIIISDIFVRFSEEKPCVCRYEFKQPQKNLLDIEIFFHPWCKATNNLSLIKIVMLVAIGCVILSIISMFIYFIYYRKNSYDYLR
jgi:hypothetical protein